MTVTSPKGIGVDTKVCAHATIKEREREQAREGKKIGEKKGGCIVGGLVVGCRSQGIRKEKKK